MVTLQRGRFRARLTREPADIERSQVLRARAFRPSRGPDGVDADAFDALCAHVLLEDVASGALVGSYRLISLISGDAIGNCYSAQFYDLSALACFQGRMVEMGRFCIAPDWVGNPDILRLAWGAMTRFVDAEGIELLFGCTSFSGTDATLYRDAFLTLKEHHLAPARWRPAVKSRNIYDFSRTLCAQPNQRRAKITMPPLLKTYLMMGGWVSDHAVMDLDLNTMHVFTGLEIAAIPPVRARLLREIAA